MNFNLTKGKIALVATSSLIAFALAGCGGGGGDTGESGESGGGSNETYTNYGAYVPLSLDAEGKISGNYFCSEEYQGDTMYLVTTYDSAEECNATLNDWVAEFNKDEAPATAEQREGLAYINDIRRGTGLPIFHGNSALEEATKNHELYLGDVGDQYNVKNMAHYEDNNTYPSDYYTGVEGTDRARYAGYNGDWAGDVISYEYRATPKVSIEGIMTAIYHRQALLWNFTNQIGIGGTSNNFGFKAHAHLMGADWSYYYFLQRVSSDVVVYPYGEQENVQRVFDNNEWPDPLPGNNDHVGNPISVSFNSSKAGEITMVSFKLFYDETDVEVTDTTLMDKNTDPNGIFTSHDFALFPMDILEGETTYRVEFDYIVTPEKPTSNTSERFYTFHSNTI